MRIKNVLLRLGPFILHIIVTPFTFRVLLFGHRLINDDDDDDDIFDPRPD